MDVFDDDIGHDGFGALDAGLAFAGMGLLMDQQTNKLLAGQRGAPEIHIHMPSEPDPVLVNAADLKHDWVDAWDDYIGQDPLKDQLKVEIASAKKRGTKLPHCLFASPFPGYGKTTLAHLVAQEMGGPFFKLVPPFHRKTLTEALKKVAEEVRDTGKPGILFIDELHLIGSLQEALLTVLEDGVLFTDDGMVDLTDVTIIGATTEQDALTEPILDRFSIVPYFQPYDEYDIAGIVGSFMGLMGVHLGRDCALAVMDACQGTPRVARELVRSAGAWADAFGRLPSGVELLKYKEIDPDGLTRKHRAYLSTLFSLFRRELPDGTWEYVAGEATIASALREKKEATSRVERLLLERGLLDRTPRGRRLTPRGIARAMLIVEDL